MKSTTPTSLSRFIPLLLGIAAVCLGWAMSSSLLARNDWNPSVFVKFPAEKPAELAYGTDMLGEVIPSGGFGHDGKYYFMQAMDPFYLSPDDHAVYLDRPTYRAQRMVYPTARRWLRPPASAGHGMGSAVHQHRGVGIRNLVDSAAGEGAGAVGVVWAGFPPQSGVLISSVIDTAEVLAMLFVVAAALMLLRERINASVAFFTLAVLTCETMLLAVVGAIAYTWHKKRSVPKAFAVPFIATGLWWLYLRAQLGHLGESVQDTKAIGLPFKGFYEAMQIWLSDPGSTVDMLMGIVLLAVSVLVVIRAIRNPNLLWSMGAGFVLLAVLMVEGVWRFYFDASRALVPVITIYLLAAPAPRRRRGELAEPIPVVADRPRV